MCNWYKDKKFRPFIIIGATAAIIVTLASASSGPFLALGIGIIGLICWYLREKTHLIRRGIVFGLIGLELAMKPPVWFIFAKLSQIFGGTGWHRSFLINQFIFFFHEWVLLGTNYTAHWMGGITLHSNPNMVDITNWYVAEGVNGGLLTLILFIYVIVTAFRAAGRARKINKKQPLWVSTMMWICSISLVVHSTSISSISYFDQIIVYWYILFATISNFIQLYNISFRKKENRQLNGITQPDISYNVPKPGR